MYVLDRDDYNDDDDYDDDDDDDDVDGVDVDDDQDYDHGDVGHEDFHDDIVGSVVGSGSEGVAVVFVMCLVLLPVLLW